MGIEDDKIKHDEMGNLIFTDLNGREIMADPNKFSQDYESLCSRCLKNYQTCENEDIRECITDGTIEKDKNGYPLVMYCTYFLEK